MGTIDFRSTKQKLEDAGNYVKSKCRNCWSWVKDNKEIVLVVVPVVGAAVTASVKGISKAVNNHRAEKIKTEYIYDPKLGFYWPTKRPLTGAEKMEYSRRYKDGENGGEILRQMKILKL